MAKYVLTITSIEGGKRVMSSFDYTRKSVAVKTYLAYLKQPQKYVSECLTKDGSVSGVDKYGREIVLRKGVIETRRCPVCKKLSDNIGTIIVHPRFHNVPIPYAIDACESCADAFETGGWTVECKKGRYRIKRLDMKSIDI